MDASCCIGCQLPDWVPLQIGQGTTVKFTRTFQCYSPPDFTYKIYFNGPMKFNAAGVPNPDATNGPGWLVTILPADTKAQAPGAYRYCERVVKGATGETYDLTGESLVTNLVPSAADGPAGAFMSFEEKTIPILEAAIQGDMSNAVQSYHIAGRAVSKYAINDLTKLLGYMRSVVWRQQHPGRLGVAYRVAFPMMEPAVCTPPTWVHVTTIG